MSFVDAVGTLMTESGLAEILASVFGGVGKMLTGKKFPMNMRAMLMLAEELLRDIIGEGYLKSNDDLMTVMYWKSLQQQVALSSCGLMHLLNLYL